MADDQVDAVRETLFQLMLECGLLRPVPVPLQVAEVVNGRAYRIVPLGMVWPSSCLYYASQDPHLRRELLISLYETKTVRDGGVWAKGSSQAACGLPLMRDQGWVSHQEGTLPAASWKGELRVVARGRRD